MCPFGLSLIPYEPFARRQFNHLPLPNASKTPAGILKNIYCGTQDYLQNYFKSIMPYFREVYNCKSTLIC